MALGTENNPNPVELAQALYAAMRKQNPDALVHGAPDGEGRMTLIDGNFDLTELLRECLRRNDSQEKERKDC